MENTIAAILQWCANNIALIIALFFVFFEVVPIKIHPLSSLCKWLGRKFNSELSGKVDAVITDVNELNKKVSNIETEQDNNEMDRIRWEILNFANSCRNGTLHTVDEFRHVITLNDKYRNLLDKHHAENGVFDEEYKYIMEIYSRCRENGTFLH